MARLRASIERAVALHRRATGMADAAQRGLDRYAAGTAPAGLHAGQVELAERLRDAAAALAPGWLGAELTAAPDTGLPTPDTGLPVPGIAGPPPERSYLRVGTGRPLDDATFPVVVPLLGTGHLAMDGDARDPRVVGLLRSVVLRLFAAHPAGTVRARAVDATGAVFPAFHALSTVGLMSAPVRDRDGLRAVLGEAEQWVREPSRRYRLLLFIAALPELAEAADLDRIAALAAAGPAARLHLVVAGWPPPPLSADTTRQPLPHAVQVTLRNPYALVGDPPGASFGAGRALNCPVYLDPNPSAPLVESVCAQVAEQVTASGSTLAELLPTRPWQESSATELDVVVGRAGDSPLTLRLSDRTPHWLLGGRSGSGRSSFLVNVLYGLCTRYSPAELGIYLLDFADGPSYAEFVPTSRDPSWIPHVRAAGIQADREYGLAVLRELATELDRRRAESTGSAPATGAAPGASAAPGAGAAPGASAAPGAGGGARAGGDGGGPGSDMTRVQPRLVCVIDEYETLTRGGDRVAAEASALLATLARQGRGCGIHLVLVRRAPADGAVPTARRDGLLGQFPVRIALPGGAGVLEERNRSADELNLGSAVVNTAGGLGGPAGASRAHERLVAFPDPHAEPEILATLRDRLWQRRGDIPEPHVFAGYARHHLPAALPDTRVPTAYLGRVVDVPLSLAGFPLSPEPGRHLAVLGPSEAGGDLLDAAARSLAAQCRPRSVHFVLCGRAAGAQPVVQALEIALKDQGHRVSVGTKDIPDNTYLFGFGLDGTDVSELVRSGHARGVHLFGWWRGVRRFTEDIGGNGTRDTLAGLVMLNLPASEVDLLLGDASPGWQPRPNRALMYDRPSGRAQVIVPFAGGSA